MADEKKVAKDSAKIAKNATKVALNAGIDVEKTTKNAFSDGARHIKKERSAKKAGKSSYTEFTNEELKSHSDTAFIKTEKMPIGREKLTVEMNNGDKIVRKGRKQKVYRAKAQKENYAFIVGKDQGLFRDSFTERVGSDGKKRKDYYTGRFSESSKRIGKKQVEIFEAERKLQEKRHTKLSKDKTMRSRRELERAGITFIGDSFLSDEEMDDSVKALDESRQKATGAADFLGDTKSRISDVKYRHEKHKIEKQKKIQKKAIKREYAKAYRQAYVEGGAKEVVHRTKQQFVMVAKKKKEEAIKKAKEILKKLGIGGIFILFLLSFFLILILFIGGGSGVGVSVVSYQSSVEDIEAAESHLNSLEEDLLAQVRNLETNYPGYYSYRYNVDDIGHNAYDLANYLNAAYPGFTYDSSMEAVIDSLFSQMYEVQLIEQPDTLYHWNSEKWNETTQSYGDWDTEDITHLYIEVSRKPIHDIVYPGMTNVQQQMYEVYQSTGGLIQCFSSPFETNWMESITRNYGTNYNPQNGLTENHSGIDVSVPLNTSVYAACTGTVTASGWDDTFGYYVYITDENGNQIRFSHLTSPLVSVGSSVTKSTVIAYAGATGTECGGESEIHIETLDKTGSYRNPIFMISCLNRDISSTATTGFGSSESGANTMTLNMTDTSSGTGGSGSGGTGGGGYTPTSQNREDWGLPETYDDPEIENLVSYAEQFLGMPYVLGGSSPSGMDCCNFVSYVLRNSGYYDTPQRGVDGLYSICYEVDDPQPGDLVFFVNTTGKGPNILSHVGLYIGNGVMIHCGNPCKYGNVNSSYWQQYFKCYARLS